jgi:protein SCO1/2
MQSLRRGAEPSRLLKPQSEALWHGMMRWFILILFAGLLVAGGCKPASQGSRPAPASTLTPLSNSTNQRTFQVKGIVIAVRPGQKEVEIRHEEVPDFMPTMTMPFEVKNTNELTGLAAGDSVSFRMVVTDTDGWIEQIRKLSSTAGTTNAAATNQLPANGQYRFVRDVEPLNPGDPLPDYHFTNQFGQRITTSQFKGQALAITFLFTRCRFPTFCPLTANNFAEAQKRLLAQSTSPTNWHLLTISFDPEYDTPAILEGYAKAFQYDPQRWSFLTGDLVEITAIADQFGLTFSRDTEVGFSHNLRTVVIDAHGRVQKIFQGNQWTGPELAEELAKAAGRS